MSIDIDRLKYMKFINNVDVSMNDQFDYVGKEGSMYVYKNKTTENLTYFTTPLVNLSSIEPDNYIVYY
ncbi:hypothetical protein [Psilogramma increta granulovirus]|uniref:Uncharacterized protein n=1 Tax=Psilogramma increta granulovirus TaxID=2953508 RepID=A0A977TP76_9BBAC|nr:hypothetical protein [Psilogramma increta granulovirus]